MGLFKEVNKEYFKSIGIWILFSIMVMKFIELFIYNNLVKYIGVPGFLVYGFFIYYSLKESSFMIYKRFIIGVIFITVGINTGLFLINRFVVLEFPEYVFYTLLVVTFSGIVIPNILYWIEYMIRRVVRA